VEKLLYKKRAGYLKTVALCQRQTIAFGVSLPNDITLLNPYCRWTSGAKKHTKKLGVDSELK
jgi:hypothetical protein